MVKRRIKNMFGRLLNNKNRNPRKAQYLHRDKHGIDTNKVSRHAIKVCEVLQENGYQAYIVGGAVRDLIAGIQPTDFDVATNATPQQIRPLFRRARIIGRRFQLVHVVFGREIIETSTFRAAVNGQQATDEHGRIVRDNLFGSQQEDADRRDFTLNALYYDPKQELVIDFHNGVADIKNRIIRVIGDPETRYREDPVRMLRAIRFAAKLDAQIEATTLAPIHHMAELIRHVPGSRLFDELLKLLTCGEAVRALHYLRDQGLQTYMLPQLDAVLQEPGGADFIELALQRTDERIRTGNTISPGFLFASLLWKLVKRYWEEGVERGEHLIPALAQACDTVLSNQARTLAIHRRFQADMREIWMMQPRFERFSKRSLWRLTEHARFRAGVGFLQLRAEAREVDSVHAQWWADLSNANYNKRVDMVEAWFKNQPGARKSSGRRRRPRRRGRRSAAKKSTPSNDNSDN